jgi:hypothetical protein
MAAAPPVQFALMPAQAFGNGLINLGDREGIALYRSVTRSLYTDPSDLFDGKPENLMGFLTLFTQRIREANWGALFNVPVVLGAAVPDLRPFTSSHGMFNMPELTLFVNPTMVANDRSTQDNFMAASALLASITAAFMTRINIHRAQYTIGDNIAAILLLKVIIRESHLDSNASTRIAREKLSSLDTHMKAQGNDILKFNAFVQTQLDALHARGESTLDLLTNLFKGYASVPNEAFVKYIDDCATKHDDGELNLTAEQFMDKAAHRYKVLLEGKLWDAPNRDQARILALQAQVNQLESSLQAPAAANAPCAGNINARNTPRAGGRFKPEPWMLVKPSDDDIKNEVPKKEGGREYWWCVHHGRYVQHKGSKCKLATPKAPPAETTPKPDGDNDQKALHLTKALVSIVERE